MDIHEKEVRFDLYCQTCRYRDTDAADDPCDECLMNPVNEGSVKPVNYEKER